uniref:NADH-ubiquinone oxidoreductase chain 4 n=1 Tax=Megalobenedenia derzhavini TaxID=3068300 RepID=A0AA49KQF2_9PLAT|nr:NADH dehydrogenase subunit 4 [Megalobenedenia derzhavini]WLG31381.1 NADH dehydrogenase subunit 4 [Megalobenedenia derzhavini]
MNSVFYVYIVNLCSLLLIITFSILLSLIPVIFFIIFFNVLYNNTSVITLFMLFISMISSIICFNVNNIILFWVFYELSILPLLFLMFVDSPYSERFLAIWYLLGYIMLTSLPMLFCLLYLGFEVSSFNNLVSPPSYFINVVLFILFITKIPLPPFHSWLPVVHAEANSYVSIMLSGYIMKLGLIGLYRFNINLLEDIGIYTILVFLFSLFFFFNSFLELDSKRWLAFLSLSHILVGLVGLFSNPWAQNQISSFYCLGHGISAGLLFYLFLCLFSISGSRNWIILSSSNSNSLVIRLVAVTSLITLASFPPSIQFISEVLILINSFFSVSLLYLFILYLFIGGLIPVLLLSYYVCRNNNQTNLNLYYISHFINISLIFFCFCWGVII